MRKGTFSSRRHVNHRRHHRKLMRPLHSPISSKASESPVNGLKAKKMAGVAKLWMRIDKEGRTEMVEWDKNIIIRHASINARDLRILGPIYSHSPNILGRERAIVMNLECIKAIVTAEEVLLLEPLRQEVIPFVEQLRQHLQDLAADELIPFEFQVLEIALEFVCTLLDSDVAELESDAYPVLDQLANKVSTQNLDFVRTLKTNLTRLLARVQKVRDEIERWLDDTEDMRQLYLTRKGLQNQEFETHSTKSESRVTRNDDNDVEELEMLLETYFMQLDATRKKIVSVREYIGDTEDYVNIELDSKRNELIQLQLTLTIASFAMIIENSVAVLFGMNIEIPLFKVDNIFWPFVGVMTAACTLIFLIIWAYAKWKKLLGS